MKLPDINISNQGIWRNSRGNRSFPPRLVLTYELAVHNIDYGTTTVNQQAYPIVKNTVLFKRPGDIVQNKFPDYRAQCEFIYFTIAPESLSAQFEHILNKIPPYTIADEAFLHLWKKQRTEYAESQTPSFEIQNDLNLISMLLILSKKEQSISASPVHSVHQTMLFRAVCYMREHLSENISVNDIASYIGYSLSHFNYLFKKYTSHTPYSYFTFMRMCEAQNLLLKTTQPISTIAETLNFKNTGKFCEAFKKEFQITPGQFRKLKEKELYL